MPMSSKFAVCGEPGCSWKITPQTLMLRDFAVGKASMSTIAGDVCWQPDARQWPSRLTLMMLFGRCFVKNPTRVVAADADGARWHAGTFDAKMILYLQKRMQVMLFDALAARQRKSWISTKSSNIDASMIPCRVSLSNKSSLRCSNNLHGSTSHFADGCSGAKGSFIAADADDARTSDRQEPLQLMLLILFCPRIRRTSIATDAGEASSQMGRRWSPAYGYVQCRSRGVAVRAGDAS